MADGSLWLALEGTYDLPRRFPPLHSFCIISRGLKEATGSAGRVQPNFTFNPSLHVLRARLFADPGKKCMEET